MERDWLWMIPAAPLATCLANGVLALVAARTGQRAPRLLTGILACLGPTAAFVLSVVAWLQLRELSSSERLLAQTLYRWFEVGSFHVDIGFTIDPLSSLMLLFVTGVGSLIHVYSTGYMRDDAGSARYFVYLNLFMFAMLLLVLGDSLPLLFVGWEGVGLCSYLLIGFWFEDSEKAAAGKKAFVVNRIGDFGVLIAMFLIVWTMQGVGKPSLAIADLRANLDAFSPEIALAACLLLFLGAAGKSAQIPLYVWLPDAMAGPTPVSALIHAATMVTAGVYMLARLHFLFELSAIAMTVVAVVGACTALLAASIAVAQNDFKKVLAYSTVSQLGYMFVGVGVGAFAAGIFHVFTHAFFKACLFLGSGAVIHALHEEHDIRNMGGLRRIMPVTFATFVIATLALAGIPPLAGFFSKDHILWESLSRSNEVLPWLPRLLWGMLLMAAFLTAFYMWRLVSLVFLGRYRGRSEVLQHAHDAPFSMAMPLVVLATGSVLVGFLGTPTFLGGSNAIEHWLHPSLSGAEVQVEDRLAFVSEEPPRHELAGSETHASAAAEWGAAGAAFASALLGLLLAAQLYVRRPEAATELAARFAALKGLLSNKYYVDEMYTQTIVRPIRSLSDAVLWRIVDQRMIDGAVNMTGGLTKVFSYVFRFAQDGYVQTYVLVVVLGALALLIRAL